MGHGEENIPEKWMGNPEYETEGLIEVNNAGDILNVYVKGIRVNFKIKQYISGVMPTKEECEDAGWEWNNGESYIPDFITSEEFD